MEKNEAFRKQVLTHLYGLPNLPGLAKEESGESTQEEEKETTADETLKEDESVTTSSDPQDHSEKDIAQDKENEKEESVDDSDKGQEEAKADHSNNNESAEAVVSDPLTSVPSDHTGSSSRSDHMSSNSNKSNTTHTTPTTTTSHLYSVLMAPLDGHSPYRNNILRFGADDADAGPRKRMRMDVSAGEKAKPDQTAQSGEVANNKTAAATNCCVGMDLTKNQKKKQKKKRRRHLLNKIEVQRAKDFIYSSENEQFSVEKLRTMIEDVTEFLDAIWDVYCSEARLKGENVEEDGCKVAAALKCLSASGEGSWGDLQLLSRAKSVLVLRSKHLAASTIARVENELGYDTDVRSFIVRMLKFWMGEVVTKG